MEELQRLEEEIEDKKNRKLKTEFYIDFLKKEESKILEFKPIYWNLILDKAIVKKNGEIKFEFVF